MIHIELDMSNDGAKAASKELKDFLGAMNDKMATNAPERVAESSTRAYVVVRRLLDKINAALTHQATLLAWDDEKKRAKQPRRSIRSVRGKS